MNFIDVGFKHYCISDGGCSYIKIIFYAVDEFDNEVNLYEWDTFDMNNKSKTTETVLKYLTNEEIENINNIINYKKECYRDEIDYSFIQNLKNEKRCLVKRYE